MLIKSCDNHETKINFSMSLIITAIVVSTISRWSRVVQRYRFALGICYTRCRGVHPWTMLTVQRNLPAISITTLK